MEILVKSLVSGFLKVHGRFEERLLGILFPGFLRQHFSEFLDLHII